MGDQELVFHDKVMQTENQPKWLPKDARGLRFVANGEIGIITEAWKGRNGKPDNAKVVFSTQPEATYSYKKSEVKEALELAYALTVHKAQGSDFETVILIVPRKAQTLSRELLYTGLTRFKGKLVLLVEKDSQPLLDLRRPEASDTMRRTTRMFKLLIGQDAGDIGIKGPYRPEGLIHRTSDGTPVRSKSEVIVYDVLVSERLSVQYEKELTARDGNPKNFRLPDEPCRTVVQLAVLTGMRIGEILPLRWKRVDLQRGTLEVAENFSDGAFGLPKTRSSNRVIPMSKFLISVLETHRTGKSSNSPEDLVFKTRTGTPLSSKNLYNRELAPACDRIKQPRVSWHSFRHTHATLLAEVGESIKTAQSLLGHSDLGTTLNTYAHVIPDSQRRAVERVAGVLFSDVLKLEDSAKLARVN